MTCRTFLSPVPPPGQLHRAGACWRCGARRGLHAVIVHITHAAAHECTDHIGCARRVMARQAAA